MKLRYALLAAAVFVLQNLHSSAAVLYVDLNSTNSTPPYADWSTAATNIQDAVDTATNGDLVLVTNGIYNTGQTVASGVSGLNRLAVTKPVTVQSVNGPAVTVIQGHITNGPTAVRCVYLATNATLIGFTLTNGGAVFNEAEGGGIFCQITATVSNCVLVGNSAFDGGGAEFGAFNNCVFSNNIANNYGGGAIDGTYNNCQFTRNSAYQGGAIANFEMRTILNNCTVYGNFATNSGGGLVSYAGFFATNSIVFGNTATNGSNYYRFFSGLTMNYCCTAPLPSGIGNITNDPAFVNPIAGDFHLQSNSPCINSGNNVSVTITNDLDGNPRIVGGTVDIGAYEYQTPTSIISYAWLQQYGLPTDGSADYLDSDGDGMNNWQEWIAGTDPTNALSVLEMLSPTATNNPSGLVVTWQSVNTRTYYLQSSINLGAQPAFSTIQSNIVGQVGTTSFTDTSATNGGPYFYRVGVQQ